MKSSSELARHKSRTQCTGPIRCPCLSPLCSLSNSHAYRRGL